MFGSAVLKNKSNYTREKLHQLAREVLVGERAGRGKALASRVGQKLVHQGVVRDLGTTVKLE